MSYCESFLFTTQISVVSNVMLWIMFVHYSNFSWNFSCQKCHLVHHSFCLFTTLFVVSYLVYVTWPAGVGGLTHLWHLSPHHDMETLLTVENMMPNETTPATFINDTIASTFLLINLCCTDCGSMLRLGNQIKFHLSHVSCLAFETCNLPGWSKSMSNLPRYVPNVRCALEIQLYCEDTIVIEEVLDFSDHQLNGVLWILVLTVCGVCLWVACYRKVIPNPFLVTWRSLSCVYVIELS